jgi:hypothetical protein
MTFGNVLERPVGDIDADMRRHFPSEESCFINRNYALLQKHGRGQIPLGKAESEGLLAEVQFGPLAKFFDIFYG